MDWQEGKIVSTPLEGQMKNSYIDYAMSDQKVCTYCRDVVSIIRTVTALYTRQWCVWRRTFQCAICLLTATETLAL